MYYGVLHFREKEEVDKKAAEVKALQKEYMKALRPKKEKPKPAGENKTMV